MRQFAETFLTGGRVRKDSRGSGTRDARTPKAAPVFGLSGAVFPAGFATIPGPFCGCGRNGRGFPGSPGP